MFRAIRPHRFLQASERKRAVLCRSLVLFNADSPSEDREAGIPLDVPRGLQKQVHEAGGWFDQVRKVWMCSTDNSKLVKKYGAHLRTYLDPVGDEGAAISQLGGHWSPQQMRWFTVPMDENFTELKSRFCRERIPVDVPIELRQDALSAGLRWCPDGRMFYVLSDDPHAGEMMAKFNGKRIYFRVAPENREEAKELGCRYDAVNCGWYSVSGSDKLHLVRDRFDETPRPSVKKETRAWPKQPV